MNQDEFLVIKWKWIGWDSLPALFCSSRRFLKNVSLESILVERVFVRIEYSVQGPLRTALQDFRNRYDLPNL
jgi:hypothetical protein